ncbi:MAG: YceI family protein [Spirochaetales bacterium]|nr:YceI family protein [Spirochaetales bacterium]
MRIALLLLLITAVACQKPGPAAECTYEYNPASTTVTWTAYKFTEKAGVSGSFDRISTEGLKAARSPTAVFETLSFRVETGSVNTKNPDRDAKIHRSFFLKLKEGESLQGSVTQIQDKEARVNLRINGVEKPALFKIQSQDGKDSVHVTFSSDLNLLDFGADSAITSLNTVCKELHTGSDGKSKLWPDVKIDIHTELKKKCP